MITGSSARNTNKLVAFLESQGNDPTTEGTAERGQRRLLDRAPPGDHREILVFDKLAHRNQASHLLAFSELEKVDNRPAGGRARGNGCVVNLEPVNLSTVCEEQYVIVRNGYERVLEKVILT